MSVYEKPLGRLDLQSQYHYTAYFEHGDDIYRLHVYFNANDAFVSQPLLSKVVSDSDFIPVACDENVAAFDLLADSATINLVKYLRAVQKEHIEKLNALYDELDTQLVTLSENIYANKSKYIAILQSQIEILRDLKHYDSDPYKVSRRIKWLSTTQKHIELLKPPVNIPVNKPVTGQATNGTVESNKNSASSRKNRGHQVTYFKEHPKSQPKQIEKANFSDVIQKLSQKHASYLKIEDDLLIDLIQPLYSELNEAEWVLESAHQYHVTFDDLKNMKAIRTKIEQMGISLLQRLLVKGCFSDAPKLAVFYRLMPESMALLALQANNIPLLDFLLKNKIIPINFKHFNIANTEYASMVGYCFNNITTNKDIEALLDILIINGASLLDLEPSSGLPYAAILLLNQQHPLYGVLNKNASLTLNNPMFYKQLNQVLGVIAAKQAISSDLKRKVKELIGTNLTRIELLKHHVDINDNKTSESLEETLGEEMVRRIMGDPDIRYYKAKIEQQVASLLPKLPMKQRKNFSRIVTLNFEVVSHAVDKIQCFDEVPSFEEIKSETIKQQMLTLELVDLRKEHLDIQKKQQSVCHYHRRPPKEFKKAIAREREIVQRAEEICDLLDKPYASINELSSVVPKIAEGMNRFIDKAKVLLCDSSNDELSL